MVFHIKKVAFQEDLLSRLAADLLAVIPASGQGDLSSCMVVLPSARACRTLGHILLEKSGLATLLLPRAVTPAQLVADQAAALGLDTAGVPDDAVRPVVLAHHLAQLDWLADRPENAPGLAREFLAFFDEARIHGRAGLLQGQQALETVLACGHSGAAEVLGKDVLRLGQVWELYRGVVPRDTVDLKVAAGAGAAERPLPAVDFLAVAGVGLLDPATASLIRARADAAGQAWLYLPRCEGLTARFLAATWGPGSEGLDPEAPARQVRRLLTGEDEPEARPEGALRQRLDSLGDLTALWAPAGPLTLAPCLNPEQESLFITEQVVQILQQPGGDRQRTAVVTNDPVLAARVVAQLRDAGIDVDDTLGHPLAGLPAGLLARFMLRAAVTGLRAEPLLEALTHPFTRRRGEETGREFATLTLERILRRQSTLPTGPAELIRLARDHDEKASTVSGEETHRLEEFVSETVAALQPLLDLASGTHPAGSHLAALRSAWRLLAPDTALTEDRTQPDVTALDRLLGRLEKDSGLLPVATLAEFAGDLNRLLAEDNVPDHRAPGLPVLVAGLVEARLERHDHLIIAGLNEGKFPTRRKRPLFLDSRVRAQLGLPQWKEALARDADLFLRLVHNAPQVLLTWSVEDGGQPLLPSPLVERLLLGRPADEQLEPRPAPEVWRRQPVAGEPVQQGQAHFLAESPAVPALAPARRPDHLSWSALRTWRECPYRFLLERGFALRKEEQVQEEFSKADFGSLVHEVLRRFLDPGGIGWAALARDQRDLALKELREQARTVFLPEDRTLPGRVLWLNSFLEWAPGLVDLEAKRFGTWRPARLEAEFELTLGDLLHWMRVEVARGPAEGAIPELTAPQEAIVLAGTIDRVDVSAMGVEECAVLDYKTGKVPPAKQVKELRELQVLLYSLALECGKLGLEGPPPRVSQAGYYAVRAEKPGLPAKPHFDGDRQVLLDAAAALTALACEAADPASYPLIPEQVAGLGPSRLPCTFCDFQGVCRLEERPGLPPPVQIKVDKLPAARKGGLF